MHKKCCSHSFQDEKIPVSATNPASSRPRAGTSTGCLTASISASRTARRRIGPAMDCQSRSRRKRFAIYLKILGLKQPMRTAHNNNSGKSAFLILLFILLSLSRYKIEKYVLYRGDYKKKSVLAGHDEFRV